MAQIQDSTELKPPPPPPRAVRRRPRVSFFLGCFRRSSGGVSETQLSYTKEKKKIKWFSLSRLRARNSPRRTVPIDDEKIQNKKGSLPMKKSSKKFSFSFSFSRHQRPAKDFYKSLIPAPVAAEEIHHQKPIKTKYDDAQDIILGNCKSMNHLDSIKKTTCKKRVSSKCKLITSKSSISHSNYSPEVKFEVNPVTAELTHAASMPPSIWRESAKTRGGDSLPNEQEKSNKSKNDGKFDQFVGMSIILVALTILIVWGKLCAILCTSAWLYFSPLLRSKREPNVTREKGSKSGDAIDVNSEEYKKKAVLEGFLKRNHRKF